MHIPGANHPVDSSDKAFHAAAQGAMKHGRSLW